MTSIGITYDSSTDLFLSGANQTAITLTELFQQLGYTVILLDRKNNDGKVDKFPKLDVCFCNLHSAANLDILIDIDGLVNPTYRKKAAKISIVFLRTFVQFSELDKSVYPEGPYVPRNFEGVSEVWCWDILNPPETLDSIGTLFPCPLRAVPFIWSPTPISPYIENRAYKIDSKNNWNIHIAEKNVNNSNSAILPMVAVRELSTHSDRIKYKCHNMKKIKENKFCKVNVLENIEFEKLPIEFVEDMPFYKWLDSENNILFSHSRFTPLRIALLNALWLGIPMIHNSPILKELHPVLNKSFYFGNRVDEILTALTYLSSNFCEEYIAATNEIKQKILEKWSISKNIGAWKIISSSFSLSPPVAVALDRKIIVAFSDMWPGFNYETNFIIDSLRHEVATLKINAEIVGVEYNRLLTPHLVIFGPYSHVWKLIPNNIPKVYFSGENWTQPDDPSISLYLSSSRKEDERHFRIPTWMTFIDWYSDSTQLPETCQDNPIRIPLHFATTTHPIPFEKRAEWCAFVVSNPVCTMRNNVFKAFNDYKRVNSGGALYNNIGGQLALKYPGGGCGDISKHKFFTDHKFTISFENSQAAGYVTEKLLHAKMAGCIPIYWGDDNAQQDFHPLSFLNVSREQSPEKILELVKNLESKPDLCAQIASEPLLRNNDVKRSLEIISNMSKKLLRLCGIELPKPLKRIDKIFVINLDTRKDRWDSLCKAEPFIEMFGERMSAVNGKTLEMSPAIKKLFKNNNFGWRKSVIGCAMSHINIWTEIAATLSGEYFMVLEDDVRFNQAQLKAWSEYAANIPQGADLLYLGGVLPSNSSVFSSVLEPVNNFWAKIKPNKYFSGATALPIFHFCTYSYIISKTAVQKMLYYIMNSGMTVAVDHFLVSMSINLNTYVANPLITRCFQDDDPNYLNANFDAAVSKFDSDIYNNLEAFDDEDKITIFTMDGGGSEAKLYEDAWIKNIFGNYCLQNISNFSNQNDCWFLLQRPHIAAWTTLFKELDGKGITFKIIHLSDEAHADSIECYKYSNCKAVIRNYGRADATLPNVLTIPLGYHYKGNETIKSFSERELVWSFHGNDWFGRAENLKSLQIFQPNNCHLIQGWAAPNMTNQTDYLATLTNSKLCPIMRGNNFETYRLYEALEAGVIPFYVRTEGDHDFWKFITSNIPLINIPTWDKVTEFISALLSNPVGAEDYRRKLMGAWTVWKLQIMADIKKFK